MDERADDIEASKRTGSSSVRHERTDDRPPTSAQLRDEMPSARTIGRSSARDPAAAPMDTDDEAAGRSPRGDAVERERAAVTAGSDGPGSAAAVSAPEETYYARDAAARSQSWATLIVVLVMVLGCVALWVAMR